MIAVAMIGVLLVAATPFAATGVSQAVWSPSSPCESGAEATSLILSERDGDVWRFVDWLEGGQRPTTAYFQEISGPCAKDVIGVSGGTIVLWSGATFRYDLRGRGSRTVVSPRMWASDDVGLPAPPLDGASFVAATKVDGPDLGAGGQRDYLGLWRTESAAIVAKFSVMDGLGAGPAEPILRVRGATSALLYSPAPDTQSGGISFLNRGSDDVVRMFGFAWDHPDAFPCLTTDQLVTRVVGGVPGPRRDYRKCG